MSELLYLKSFLFLSGPKERVWFSYKDKIFIFSFLYINFISISLFTFSTNKDVIRNQIDTSRPTLILHTSSNKSTKLIKGLFNPKITEKVEIIHKSFPWLVVVYVIFSNFPQTPHFCFHRFPQFLVRQNNIPDPLGAPSNVRNNEVVRIKCQRLKRKGGNKFLYSLVFIYLRFHKFRSGVEWNDGGIRHKCTEC